MKVTFLGTSGSMPTPDRGSSSVAVRLGRDILLFDCGEGTQRQMVAAHIGFTRVSAILVTHLHGDHVLGAPGLLQSMTLQRRETPLDVYGPRGTHAFLQCVSDTVGGPGFPVAVHEITEPGVVAETRAYAIMVAKVDHRVEAWSYALTEKPRPGRFHPEKAKEQGVPQGELWKRLQDGEDVTVDRRVVRAIEVVDPPRPGRKVVYTGDTRPSDEVARLAMGADLLIHEATFGDELAERAVEDGHSTATQAAGIALKANVKKLILTHISGRYGDAAPLIEAARKVFPDTEAASDFATFEVPLA